jgi:hypothetical protein
LFELAFTREQTTLEVQSLVTDGRPRRRAECHAAIDYFAPIDQTIACL